MFNMNVVKFKAQYGHNPYFSRWFSAIKKQQVNTVCYVDVTILILVDGFLQYTTDFIKSS